MRVFPTSAARASDAIVAVLAAGVLFLAQVAAAAHEADHGGEGHDHGGVECTWSFAPVCDDFTDIEIAYLNLNVASVLDRGAYPLGLGVHNACTSTQSPRAPPHA